MATGLRQRRRASRPAQRVLTAHRGFLDPVWGAKAQARGGCWGKGGGAS